MSTETKKLALIVCDPVASTTVITGGAIPSDLELYMGNLLFEYRIAVPGGKPRIDFLCETGGIQHIVPTQDGRVTIFGSLEDWNRLAQVTGYPVATNYGDGTYILADGSTTSEELSNYYSGKAALFAEQLARATKKMAGRPELSNSTCNPATRENRLPQCAQEIA